MPGPADLLGPVISALIDAGHLDYQAYLDPGPSFSDQARDFNDAYQMDIVEIRRLLGVCP